MLIRSILFAAALTAATTANAALSDPAIFAALEGAGPTGRYTAIADGDRIVLLPSCITEVEVRAEALISGSGYANAAAALGYLAAAAMGTPAAAV